MPDDIFDPFETDKSDPSESEPLEPEEDQSVFSEADEPETYGLGKPVELPDLFTPLPPVIEPLEERAEYQPSEETSWNLSRRAKLTEGEDPLVGDTLVSALWYPLAGQGIKVLGLYTGIFWLVPLIPPISILLLFQMILAFVAGSYAGLLLLETAAFTLERIPTGPRFPEIGFDTLQAGMFALAVMVIATIPLMVINALPAETGTSLLINLFLQMGGVCFVMFYVPMGLLVIAVIEDVAALNPIIVFRGIGKMPGAYFGMVTAAVFSFAVPYMILSLSQVHWALLNLIACLLLITILVVLMRAVSIVFRDRGIQLDQSE